MDSFKEDLFDKKTIKRLTENIPLSESQINSAAEWIKLLENDQLKGETNQYLIFADKILDKILGYHLDKIIHHENDVEYQYADASGKKILCIEAKGTKTKSVFEFQNRPNKAHRTPIHQTWDYMRTGDLEWGICTNYKYFALLKRNEGTRKGYLFDFIKIKSDPEKLKEFVGIFSRENLVDGDKTYKIYSESGTEEKEFTNEFYKLFHETRLMLITAFKEEKRVTHNEAVYFTQLFLDRLIFIFFASDRGYISDRRLFSNRILKLLELGLCTIHSKKIYDEITELFTAFDKGDDNLGVFGFNGGLFNSKFPERIYFSDLKDPNFFKNELQYSKLLKTTKLNERDTNIINKYQGQLNPIIKNLLILDSFDFHDEVNVNILGHIFEQSISDLEELSTNTLSKRKKDGVYYTPPQLTEYICNNTIIPHLSKNDVTTIEELIEEYSDNIEELEKKFNEIKILDPACGSGAFLIKAVDTLIEIGEAIQNVKETSGKYATGKDTKLDKWSEEESIHNIIENNIFGVDINRESVGITQLGLFLKLAAFHRKLIGLSANIQVGNSLIDDVSVDSSALLWNERFPTVFLHPNLKKHIDQKHEDGFDIIIGNPPWQIVKPDIDEFFSPLYDSKEGDGKFSLLTKPKKTRFIQNCMDDSEIKKQWNEYENHYKTQMSYFNNKNNFEFQTSIVNGKTASSDLNLYKLFIEKSFKLLKPKGKCGLVVPSGIYSDLGTKGLRELIFYKNTVVSICSFINRKGIFEDVHRQFKFCTLIFKKLGITEKFLAKFYVADIEKLKFFNKESFVYDLKLIKKSSPSSLSILECSNELEATILNKMYKFPLLLDSNAWNFRASAELHMTADSNLFHTSKLGYPLYEGKMINQFENDFSPPRYWVESESGEKHLMEKETSRIKRFLKNNENSIIPQIHCDYFRLVWRTITNSTNERTLITTVLPPKVFLGHSLNYLQPIYFDGTKYVQPISNSDTIFLCGLLNSFVIDFILRHKVATNMTIFYLMELPVPIFDKTNKNHKKILEIAGKLICKSEEFNTLAKELEISTYVIEPDKRFALIAQLNAIAAKIYDLTLKELEFILSTFPIVDSKLKEAILDEFTLLK